MRAQRTDDSVENRNEIGQDIRNRLENLFLSLSTFVASARDFFLGGKRTTGSSTTSGRLDTFPLTRIFFASLKARRPFSLEAARAPKHETTTRLAHETFYSLRIVCGYLRRI